MGWRDRAYWDYDPDPDPPPWSEIVSDPEKVALIERLEDVGYDFDEPRGSGSEPTTAELRVSVKRRVARRDHKSGKVKAGDQYTERVTRFVDLDTGCSWHEKVIRVTRKFNPFLELAGVSDD